ncbi:MAG: glycosyltransferase family 9 protein [Bdellovibrionales bacterium]|nr:glycosyltransferase family 9 protein [Bdellovibrionales bacterium]
MMRKRHAHKEKVLLVNITRLGDMLQATPTIAGMKLENPECKVTVVVEKQFDAVCRIIPNIDEVVSIDLGMTVRSLARGGEGVIDAYDYISDFVDDLKERQFDYCLNMSSSAYTAMLLNAIGIKRSGGWSSDDEGYRVIESDWARLFASSVFHQNRQYNSLNLVDVFRCSADVELHPNQLMLDVSKENEEFAERTVRSAGFTNTGPLVVVQAGASQAKRQWAPAKFIRFIKVLIEEYDARIVLTGAKKEATIVDPIEQGCSSPNVLNLCGKTSIPELAAVLKSASLLVTGDTGPMHIAAAVGTPSVSMFLASAFAFETGPYSADNIILQPLIGCGPCNPNKPCARPDCHDQIDPEFLAKLCAWRLDGNSNRLPDGWLDPTKVIAYRTTFDQFGFYNLEEISDSRYDSFSKVRDAYRMLWLEDLAGYDMRGYKQTSPNRRATLSLMNEGLTGLERVVDCAKQGQRLISDLCRYIRDERSAPSLLGQVNERISELDREIEQIGYHYSHLGPITRMFVFAKENLSGTEALDLASQMTGIYADLERRCFKLGSFYTELS